MKKTIDIIDNINSVLFDSINETNMKGKGEGFPSLVAVGAVQV